MSKKEFIIGILCIFGVVGLIDYVRLSAKQGAILDAGIEIVPGEKAIIEIDPCMPNIVFVDSTGTKLEWTVNGRTLKVEWDGKIATVHDPKPMTSPLIEGEIMGVGSTTDPQLGLPCTSYIIQGAWQ